MFAYTFDNKFPLRGVNFIIITIVTTINAEHLHLLNTYTSIYTYTSTYT